MPFASNNEISHDPIEGGIEISEDQYLEALDAMLDGKKVVVDGNSLSFEEPKEPEVEEPEPVPLNTNDVDAERDRRINDHLTFQGNEYQVNSQSREDILGASQLAFMSIVVNGSAPGDLRWQNPDEDFAWINYDNEFVPMDAPTVIEFAKHVALNKQAHIMAARNLKNMETIPEDFKDNKYWP